MVHHIQTKIWFTFNNTNNFDMVALKRDKVLENSIKNASYNVTILIFVG
jgi:hypothetical protein